MSDWQLISVFKGIIKSLIMIDRSHDLLLHADWSICTTWPISGFLIGLYRSVPHYYLYNKKNIYTAAWRCEFYFLVAKIILPLENKIHIFAPPCNILYVLYCIVTQTFVTLPPKQKNSDLFPKYLAVLWFLFFFDHSVMFTFSKVNVFYIRRS